MNGTSGLIGVGVFGPAYLRMLLDDVHAPGSVDCVLVERMLRLCEEAAAFVYDGYTPAVAEYVPGSRPELEQAAARACVDRRSDETRLAGIARFCAALGEGAESDPDALRFGGTEEAIIERGSDWCTDVARVACALCQVAGLPARIVYLADTERAYCGHAIIEAYRSETWGAVDPVAGIVYAAGDGEPASTWDLMRDAAWFDDVPDHPLATPDQFRAAAVVNYPIRHAERYAYPVTSVNAYYRSILTASQAGWPDGLRWLRGEDG
jgi:transglutaminase-like putative cysteine protease